MCSAKAHATLGSHSQSMSQQSSPREKKKERDVTSISYYSPPFPTQQQILKDKFSKHIYLCYFSGHVLIARTQTWGLFAGSCLQAASPAHSDLVQVRDLLGFTPLRRAAPIKLFQRKVSRASQPPPPQAFAWPWGLVMFEILLLISDLALRRVNCSPPGWSRPAATPQ